MPYNVSFTVRFLLLFFQPLRSNKKVGSSEDEIEGALCLFCIFCTKSGPQYDKTRCLKRRGLGGVDSPSWAPYKRPLLPLNAPRGTRRFWNENVAFGLSHFHIFTVRIIRSLLEKNTKHREWWKLGRHKKASSTLQTIIFFSQWDRTPDIMHTSSEPLSPIRNSRTCRKGQTDSYPQRLQTFY